MVRTMECLLPDRPPADRGHARQSAKQRMPREVLLILARVVDLGIHPSWHSGWAPTGRLGLTGQGLSQDLSLH